ncbi:alpha-glucosidase [Flavobacterium sp. ASW18X]|uniref:alpha-glucosidase n=1 Tax=Flavobacterium sp. ASW18X TaxID=2572595 RepID=UPI001F116039|nr:alpha-glucosidase [Flavobacterium sp. ASW18X]
MMEQTWWKEAVVYQIYPRSFNDTTGSGLGDLMGIVEKLDYLKNLGVDVLWLSPIFGSPDDDNGYDISDYRDISEKFGVMAHFDVLLEEAHKRGLKIVLDLVVNHSSDEHPWFVESRKSEDNPYRDYYFWRKEKPSNWQSFFGGDCWEYDATTDAYYLHLFSKKQPDLNWENPKVRQEVYDLMTFWLDKGVDGFRMDVIPMISKRLDFPDTDPNDFTAAINEVYTNGPRLHEFLQEMNKEVLSKYDALSMGEGIGVDAEQGLLYTSSKRKELQMVYHFEHMALDWGKRGKFDIKQWQLTEFKSIFRRWEATLKDEGWVTIFLDNHDFPRMVSRFGNDTTYRVESAKLLATLLFSQKGTPCIYQGSEIGMTNVRYNSVSDYDDIEIRNKIAEWQQEGKDLNELKVILHHMARDNARTPMQWNREVQSGFTSGKPWLGINPNYTTINVESAMADTDSIWHYYKNMLALRKEEKTLVYGQFTEYMQSSEQVYIYQRSMDKKAFLVLLNFSDESQILDAEVPMQLIKSKRIGNYNRDANKVNVLRPWEAVIYEL